MTDQIKKSKAVKKTKPKKVVAKETALVVKKDDPAALFAGSASLVQNDKPQEKQLIQLVAKAFNLPAVCVNIMGGLPYINKDGLVYKLEEYEGKQIKSITSKAVQYATKKGETAIYETTLVLKDGREFNATGEASEESVKLAAVKVTLNMMAETRSQNRCIRKAIQARMLKDLYTGLGQGQMKDDEREIIEQAVSTSPEEMERAPKPVAKKVLSADEAMEQAMKMIAAEKDTGVLMEWHEKIKASKIYSPNQRQALTSAISNKVDELTK